MKKIILILIVMIGFGISTNAQKPYRVTYSIEVLKIYKTSTNNQEFSEVYKTEDKVFDVNAKDEQEAKLKSMNACTSYCKGDEYCCVERKANSRGVVYDWQVYYRKIASLISILER